jgi:hypothetical protein
MRPNWCAARGGEGVNRTHIEPDDFDRLVKLLVDSGQASSFEAAEALLATYRLQVLVGSAACAQAAWQAAALTAVNAGRRAMHGGVRVVLGQDAQCRVPVANGELLSAALRRYGATVADDLDTGVPTIVLGEAQPPGEIGPAVHAVASEWTAGVSPTASRALADRTAGEPSVLAAVMAAALAVSEAFQRLRGYSVAGERDARVSLWNPEIAGDEPAAEGPPIQELPAGVWLLGLGHLGQAYAWLLSLLPYPPDASRPLNLHDDDHLSHANRATSMLDACGEEGELKTQLVSTAMRPLGWDPRLIEHRYLGGPLHGPGDPAVLLAGVDSPATRRLFDETGFPVIVDAGLGVGPDGFLGMAIRRLPGSRASRDVWPATAPFSPSMTAAGAAAYRDLEARTGDRCGVQQLAGRTVATAFVGVTAACWAIGGLLRELHGGRRYELIDYTLRDPSTVVAIASEDQRPPRVPTVACAKRP